MIAITDTSISAPGIEANDTSRTFHLAHSSPAELDRADMARLAAGDEFAMNRLIARHAKTLKRHLRRLVADNSSLDDVLQDAFQRVYAARHNYDPRFAFATWLYAIARHRALDYRKREERVRQRFIPLEDALDEALSFEDQRATPCESAASHEFWVHIDQLVRTLPPSLREALTLCCEEDSAHDELAVRLHCTPKALESRLYRARATLRLELEAQEQQEMQPPLRTPRASQDAPSVRGRNGSYVRTLEIASQTNFTRDVHRGVVSRSTSHKHINQI